MILFAIKYILLQYNVSFNSSVNKSETPLLQNGILVNINQQ